MDLLKDSPKKLYLRYLSAALGGTLIMSVYATVDTIAIGQYEGPNGTAAVTTFGPIFNMIFALGLLFGIGGSVLMAHKRGEGDARSGNLFFTRALVASIAASAVLMALLLPFASPFLQLCGAHDEAVLTLAMAYSHWIILAAPCFVVGQALVPFIRNDNAPFKTTLAVMVGGVFNMVGDWFFVFVCDMGAGGAGLATALGQLICFLILLTHFRSKKCALRIVRDARIPVVSTIAPVIKTGCSVFIIDLAVGVLNALFNNQILHYFNTAALSVYGVIGCFAMLLQTFAYSCGESAQAIMSINYGARQYDRVRAVFRYSCVVAVALSVLWSALMFLFPNSIVSLYMNATDEVLAIAPGYMRRYAVCILLMGFNVNSTYYFQSVERPNVSTCISLLRGIILGGLFLLVLPLLFGGNALWFAMACVEVIVFVYVQRNLRRPLRA